MELEDDEDEHEKLLKTTTTPCLQNSGFKKCIEAERPQSNFSSLHKKQNLQATKLFHILNKAL